jgi:hypothetical protein
MDILKTEKCRLTIELIQSDFQKVFHLDRGVSKMEIYYYSTDKPLIKESRRINQQKEV